MEAEDEAALSVMANRAIPHSEIEIIDEVRERLKRVVSVTSSFPGSVAILRALRTTPVMLEVRRASTAKVAARWFDRLRETFPDTDPTRLRRGAWLGLEVSAQVIELIVEGESRAAGDGGIHQTLGQRLEQRVLVWKVAIKSRGRQAAPQADRIHGEGTGAFLGEHLSRDAQYGIEGVPRTCLQGQSLGLEVHRSRARSVFSRLRRTYTDFSLCRLSAVPIVTPDSTVAVIVSYEKDRC